MASLLIWMVEQYSHQEALLRNKGSNISGIEHMYNKRINFKSMIFLSFLNEANKHLPLVIEEAECDETTFSLRGKDWQFNGMTEWRLFNKGHFWIGCYDDDAGRYFKKLEGM